MRFLTKLAGGVALGSAVLLLGAPATAFAATDDGATKEPRSSHEEKSKKKSDGGHDTYNLRDKEGKELVCAANKQTNELNVSNIIKGNTITDSVIVITQNVASSQTNESGPRTIVCIRDLELDAKVEADLLGDLFKMVERSGIGRVASPAGQRAGKATEPTVAYAGPEGAWVFPATGSVAAGDGGAFTDTNTGALVTTGAGMMGVAALVGIALLRRRSANGTVA